MPVVARVPGIRSPKNLQPERMRVLLFRFVKFVLRRSSGLEQCGIAVPIRVIRDSQWGHPPCTVTVRRENRRTGNAGVCMGGAQPLDA